MGNLWAPWRLAYIKSRYPQPPGCFLCNAWADRGNEAAHLLLARGDTCFVIMNRFPYNSGHLMVCPVRHIGSVEEVDEAEAAELWSLTVMSKSILTEAMNAQGFNIGINQGNCAGAGVLDHLHQHVVPRWNGDKNFMPVLGEVHVIPQLLEQGFAELRPRFLERGLA